MTRMILNGPITRFLDPDDGGSGGGGGGGGTATATPPADIFAGLEIDDLPAEQRQIIEAARTQVATLQTNAAKAEREARLHQGRYDQTQAELKRIRDAANPGTPQAKTPQQEVYDLLVGEGMPPDAARVQAPIFAKMLGTFQQRTQQEVAGLMAPVVHNTLGQQAQASFHACLVNDPMGAMTVEAVRNDVWESCRKIVGEGSPVTPEVVQNLRSMAYMKHLEAGGAPATPGQPGVATLQPGVKPNLPMPSLNSGGVPFTFTAAPAAKPNPNAPRTTLDANTTLALQAVVAHWKPGAQLV